MAPADPGAPDLITSLQILNRIGASILAEFTTEQIIDTVYFHVNQLMDAHSFAIGIYQPATGRFAYTGAREHDQVLPFFSADAHSTNRFSGWVFAHRQEVFINDYEQEYTRYLPKSITPLQGLEPASLMYMPLFDQQGTMTGILSVRSPRKNAYSHQSLELLRTLAVFIGRALEHAQVLNAPRQPARPLPKSYFLDPLSARELEVLHLLAKGLPNRAIADALFVSPSTVKTHTLNIYQKLEVANRTEAIVRAKEYGLIV